MKPDPPHDDTPAAPLRAAFEQLLELPDEAREAWVASLDDAALRANLRRLLAADTGRGALDTPAAERAARIGEVSFQPEGLVGTCLGGFRLFEVLGQGGMATVFRAVRDDPAWPQQVALKLLRRGLYTEWEQRLFRRERQALAALSHPNIAHLIDGGFSAAGVPYLVLEYVDGVPITEHAATRRLGLAARLQLFVQVCRAVAAAHRALVVHRDLKPSNILVDRDGRPKLLDFGIAKMLDDAEGDATGTGLAALTPGYAAPEQYSGAPVSTATDVYALGVLLHELLLGTRPLPDRRVAQAQTVAAGLPLAPAALRRALRGDLGTVLGQALASEPVRRYASAAELGDDVAAFLAARPIAAHPPSRRYRLGKFVRRHRAAVGLGAAFVLGLVASLGLALWQAREVQRQAQRAGEVQAFVEALFEPLESGRAEAPTLSELLQRGLQRLPPAGEGDPRLRADLLAMFARIQDGVGETAANRTLAAAAVQANAQAYGPDDRRTLEARSLHGRVLRKLGERDAALAEYRAVQARYRALRIGGQDYARLLDAISIVRMEQGMPAEEAIALKHEVLRVREADPSASDSDLTVGYNNLGAAYQYAARFEDALHWYRKALARGSIAGADSRTNANTLTNIGHVLSYQGRLREADARLDEARAMFARLALTRGEGLASLLLRQCMVLAGLERHAAARERCDQAVAMARDVHGAEHPSFALALARRAGAAVAAGDLSGAAERYAAARAALAALGGDRRYQLSIVDADQARLWLAQRDWAALRQATLALLDAPARAGAPHPGKRAPSAPLLTAWAALACLRAPAPECGTRRPADADAVLDDPAFGQSVLRFGAALALAEVDLEDGDDAASALARLDRAAPWAEPDLDPGHSWRVQWHRLRAVALAALGRDAESRRDALRAEALADTLPAGHWLRTAGRE